MDPGPIGAHDDGELSELKALDKSLLNPWRLPGRSLQLRKSHTIWLPLQRAVSKSIIHLRQRYEGQGPFFAAAKGK